MEEILKKFSSDFLAVASTYPVQFTLVFLFLFIVVLIAGVFIPQGIATGKQEDKFKLTTTTVIEDQDINMKEATEVLQYLNELITEKFNYHLHTKLLPLYISDKTPDISVIKEIKAHVYVSVTTSISSPMKKLILKYHPTKGIQILIHEKILTLINEVDFTMTKRKNTSNAFKDININNVDQLLKG